MAGGDRLPWVRHNGEDNYEPLSTIGWQVHVYGEAAPALAQWCAVQGLALHVFGWSPAHAKAGLQRGAVYLLRPDSYVALTDASGQPGAIEAYMRRHGLDIALKA